MYNLNFWSKHMRPHIYYLDPLRLIAAFFVVFMHTVYIGLNTDVARSGDWFVLAGITSLAFCAVPLFFMISGFLLTSSDRTSDVCVLLKERLPKLIVPLAFWSIAILLYRAGSDHSLSGLLPGIMSAIIHPVITPLWFLYLLIVMYAISPVLCPGLRSLDGKGEIYILALIGILELKSIIFIVFPGFASEHLRLDVFYYLNIFDSHLCSFILGWFLGKSKHRIPQPALLCICAALFGIIFYGTIVSSEAAGAYCTDFQNQAAGLEVALAACIFLLFKQSRFWNRKHRLSSAAAGLTYPVYLMHGAVLIAVPLFNTALCGLAETISIYLFCLAVSWVLSRIPIISYICTGRSVRRNVKQL